MTQTRYWEKRKAKMAFEIPKDLITQLHISLRKQANVLSYDPGNLSLPSLNSLLHSFSDSPHLRCLHCKAHLLRGSDSLLCIFCGKYQTNSEAPPQPIKFKSTAGYRWFLHSLNLDGSEIVGESLEGNKSNRGPQKGFPLSDLLDLEIRWNDAEPENFEFGFGKNNPLNLAGLDLDDDFLPERKGDSESCGSVSAWQADFQSADSITDQNAIRSQFFDPFVGSSKDISSQMDMVFGQGKNLFDGKENDNQTSLESKGNDWFQYDMKGNSTYGDQVQISAGNVPGKITTNDDDDSFDAWNDSEGSTSAQDAAQSSWDPTAGGLKPMHEKVGEPFSGLGAGSGSTVSETHHEVFKSFDHFAGSSADLSSHMDSVFATLEQEKTLFKEKR